MNICLFLIVGLVRLSQSVNTRREYKKEKVRQIIKDLKDNPHNPLRRFEELLAIGLKEFENTLEEVGDPKYVKPLIPNNFMMLDLLDSDEFRQLVQINRQAMEITLTPIIEFYSDVLSFLIPLTQQNDTSTKLLMRKLTELMETFDLLQTRNCCEMFIRKYRKYFSKNVFNLAVNIQNPLKKAVISNGYASRLQTLGEEILSDLQFVYEICFEIFDCAHLQSKE
ncbi:hypothetical protein TUBRATIS_24810 [Tubulinosema ratisbonensis]|uniref:Uncharacterized protein n=1 Tax=Tubulinosema ratisbonensis TaxID=291195 RepID=A0A437AIS2_9MICR|nr:hypothetical protein TUBRATIS_24810 [Tubulinosema ratisbonensis]